MTRTMTRTVMGLVGVLAMGMPVMAGDFSLNLGIGWGGRNAGAVGLNIGDGVRLAVAAAPVVVHPVVPVQRLWVPPVYQTVIERVWVPTVETRYRDVPVVNAFGHVIQFRREAYTVPGGYWQNVERQVVVHEGYWTTTTAGIGGDRLCETGGFLARPGEIRGVANVHHR